MKDQVKNPTWGKLKEFVNQLDEKYMDQPIIWWGDERGGILCSIYQLDEDYINTDEYYEPASVYDNEKELEEAKEDGDVLEKGTPILSVD